MILPSQVLAALDAAQRAGAWVGCAIERRTARRAWATGIAADGAAIELARAGFRREGDGWVWRPTAH